MKSFFIYSFGAAMCFLCVIAFLNLQPTPEPGSSPSPSASTVKAPLSDQRAATRSREDLLRRIDNLHLAISQQKISVADHNNKINKLQSTIEIQQSTIQILQKQITENKQIVADHNNSDALDSEDNHPDGDIPPGNRNTPKNQVIHKVVDAVRRKGWSFLDQKALMMHASLIANTRSLRGVMIECGVANGGTAMVAAASKAKKTELHLFDTFTGMPKPSDHDDKDVHNRYKVIKEGKAGPGYYGYNKNLLSDIKNRFGDLGLDPETNNVHFHPGLFQDTLNVTSDVVYAHLDGDWYESTMTGLTRVVPRVVAGGYVVVDDYFAYSGCRKAVDEFFGVTKDSVIKSNIRYPLVVVKFGRKWSMSKRERLVIQAM